MLKKIAIALLSVIMLFSLAACGNKDTASDAENKARNAEPYQSRSSDGTDNGTNGNGAIGDTVDGIQEGINDGINGIEEGIDEGINALDPSNNNNNNNNNNGTTNNGNMR